MDGVKDELQKLTPLLDGIKPLLNFWDYLIQDRLLSWLRKRFPSLRAMVRRRVRLMLFVDDLDRCPPEKIIEVLQSLVLLTEDTPFVVILAVDPRVIVSAIESSDSHFFGDVGINGNFYRPTKFMF